MSCPYFYPVEPRLHEAGSACALLPLGDLWAGFCRAVPGEDHRPEESRLLPLCHLGYARGACSRFPAADPGPDAVRFCVSRHDSHSLRLRYVLERDHRPFAQGTLEYSVAKARFADTPPGEIVTRQAEAYVATYLRRKASLEPQLP